MNLSSQQCRAQSDCTEQCKAWSDCTEQCSAWSDCTEQCRTWSDCTEQCRAWSDCTEQCRAWYGTFGWLGAYLSRGTTVYYSGFPMNDSWQCNTSSGLLLQYFSSVKYYVFIRFKWIFVLSASYGSSAFRVWSLYYQTVRKKSTCLNRFNFWFGVYGRFRSGIHTKLEHDSFNCL